MFIVLLERLSIAGVFIMVISFFHFVILTHKFCGPLVNMGRTISRISEGDFTRKVYLRRGDFLKNEAKQVNAMMLAVSNSIAVIKKENLLLLEDLAESIQAYQKQTDFNTILKNLHDRADRCQVQLNQFRLIGESINDSVADQLQRQHLVEGKSPSANICS
jgi:methyl-accepting chemotaxis protein